MNQEPLYFVIGAKGGIQTVATPDAEAIAAACGLITKRRASHVLPEHPLKRFAFRVIRLAVGERGRVSDWCRSWRGPWQVRFAETPHRVEFRHPSRRVCIAWEVEQLQRRFAAQ